MITFKDKTFCASPNCVDECGRKMTEQEKESAKEWNLPVAYAYFCFHDGIQTCNGNSQEIIQSCNPNGAAG